MFFREGLFVFIFLHDFSFWQILRFHKCALHIQEMCNSIIWYFMDRQANVNVNSLEYSKWVQCCFKHVFIFNLRQQLYFLNESKLKWGDDNCSIYDTFDLNYLKARMSWYIRKKNLIRFLQWPLASVVYPWIQVQFPSIHTAFGNPRHCLL